MLIGRLRKPRLLIVGCGDIGMRLAGIVQGRFRVIALTSSPHRIDALRQLGITPLVGNLDDDRGLWRLRALARWVAVLAPPPGQGERDSRSRRLAGRLRHGMIGAGAPAQRLVYASTSGVYGDCRGMLVSETRPAAPRSARARRRLDAEACWRDYGRSTGARVGILRIPGIYDAGARSPRRRLRAGWPALRAADDVYTNHIHADDLARGVFMALMRAGANRVYNISDDSRLKVGDYLELAARLLGETPPARVARSELLARGLPPGSLDFLEESKRLDATRMQRELGLRLLYPDVLRGLLAQP